MNTPSAAATERPVKDILRELQNAVSRAWCDSNGGHGDPDLEHARTLLEVVKYMTRNA
jgi:hypothetical protein